MGGGNKGRGKRKKQCRKKSKYWRQPWKELKLRTFEMRKRVSKMDEERGRAKN